MPIARATTTTAGIVEPEDLRLLDEVFEATAAPNETENDREARAFLIVTYFQSGIQDRDALIEAVLTASG